MDRMDPEIYVATSNSQVVNVLMTVIMVMMGTAQLF
jgi:hypothetical protein